MTVIVIGMFDSPHFGRWLSQFSDNETEFVLLPSSPHRRIHPILRDLISGKNRATYRPYGCTQYLGLPLWLLDKFFQNSIRAQILRSATKKLKPRMVHALEIQNAGYIVLKAFSRKKPENLRLALTNYGSDIYWFRRFPHHRKKIERLLELTDLYAAECSRDVSIAKEMGFDGEIAPLVPNAGGIQSNKVVSEFELTTDRTTIAVKGYHGWVGRAHNVLRVMGSMKEELKDYQIVFFSCNWSTMRLASRVRRATNLDIKYFGKGKLSHDHMLELFGRSKIYIGISESDGISTSMLEAMSQGAIPVQTLSSCADEWLNNSGVIVPDTSEDSISIAITKGLEMASRPGPAKNNRDTILLRATSEIVRKKIRGFYA